MAEMIGKVNKLRLIPPTLQFIDHLWRMRTLGGCAHNLVLGGGRLLIFSALVIVALNSVYTILKTYFLIKYRISDYF